MPSAVASPRAVPSAAPAVQPTPQTSPALTVATAESLTGGALAAAVVDVPGASACFEGAVVSYSNRVKTEVLGVPARLLAERGSVDPDVAVAMAEGVRRRLGTDWAVSTTGAAGPGPHDGKPVGTVYLGASTLYKPWPAIGTAHSHIHATIELIAELDVAVDDIDD